MSGIPVDGALIAASFSAIVGLTSWFFTHRQLRQVSARQEWSLRYQSALESLTSRDNTRRQAGLDLMKSLVEARWSSKSDKTLALDAVSLFENGLKGRSTWKK
ncbi:hypothetical protein HD599_000736 [Conyzicola lurida]|uniref:Uncharacterized protein n=1 Tax=Conyzicola lurida TaxID=1172621 RepID=A0A841ALA8_9MICO|nr:hypothetical protein [Conyzicola lurida]MBB5842413.1 hypothetical protein [Conyzicola lurida]